MKTPVDEKNLKIMPSSIGNGLSVAGKIEPFTLLSIYKVYFTNVKAI